MPSAGIICNHLVGGLFLVSNETGGWEGRRGP